MRRIRNEQRSRAQDALMGIKSWLVNRGAKRFHVEDSLAFFAAAEQVGTKADVAFPTDLAPWAARLVTRGIFTQTAIQPNLDWVLPYWATRQFDEHDISFLPRMNWCALNLTHRNWTAVGVPGSTREMVVDPRGLTTPWFEGWSLDAWVEVGGRTLFPSREKQADQAPIDNLPLIRTGFDGAECRLELETFATVIAKTECVLVQARVVNKTDRSIRPTLYFSVRPFNPEGAALVQSIEAPTKSTLLVNGALGVWFDRPSDLIYCGDAREGDCAFFLHAAASRPATTCPAGLANAFARFPLELPPGGSAAVTAAATTQPVRYKPKRAAELRVYDYRDRRDTARADWRQRAAAGCEVTLPDRAMADAFERCKAHLLLADDGDYITPGVMTYHHYWFRDSAYMITALDRLGFHDAAAQTLRNYPDRQQADGFFLSQPGEWDSAGQAIWTLVEHARLVGDRHFLETMFEPIAKGAEWLVRTRGKQSAAGPTKGLLPPGFSAEHFGPNDFYYWDDYWGAAGLRDAAWAAAALDMHHEAGRLEKEAADFLADIRASLDLAAQRLGRPSMPTGPYRRFDCAAIGGAAALYPLRLFDPFDPALEATLDELQEKHFFENGFFQQMVHSGINAYLTMHIAHCRVLRREPRAWPMIHYVLGKATSAGAWPEAIHPRTGGGCKGDGLHLWAAADWLLLTRDLLLFEENDGLVVTAAPRPDWFEWGCRIEARRLPTHFGPVSLRVEGFSDHVTLHVEGEWRRPPLKLEWNLPFAVETAVVDGRETNVNDYRVVVPGGVREIKVQRG
jgi:hypothetical protein